MSPVQDVSAPELARQLEQGARALGVGLSEAKLATLFSFARLLQKWNRAYNLTAIRDQKHIVSHHLLDSLVLARFVSSGSLLDVGSGGGFPGIPLAATHEQLAVTLLDSSQKKTAFLRQAAAELGLHNVRVVCERVERWQPGESFGWIVSRAFAALGDFIAAAQHLLAPGGVFAAMKGVYPEEEMRRLPPGFRVRDCVEVSVPGLDAERHIVMVERA